jgi:excisionase family DNA binding protein
LVGARGFEPPTFCSQNLEDRIPGGVNGSQPSEIITESDPAGVQLSQPLCDNAKDFTTRLLPDSRDPRAGVQVGERVQHALADPGWGAPGTAPRTTTSPTMADLYALQARRDRLLTVRDAADMLGVGTWAVYRLCETGELPHIRIVESIRIRPADLAAFIAQNRP